MRHHNSLLVVTAASALVLSGCSLFGSEDSIDVATAQEQFCSDVADYVEAIGAYGGLFEDVELTVGDVKSAADELEPGRQAVEESAAEFRQAVESDPDSPVSIDLIEPESLQAVETAEEAFAQASDIDDSTPLIEAGVEFSSAAYQLEVAWTRLFADAGCLEGDARAQAEADQWVSEYVSAIQNDLAAIGYYDGAIDGIYGPQTIEAVEHLQADNGLPVTGLLDPPTQAVLGTALGARTSAQVGALQAILIAAGYYSGPVDGVWSDAVESALIALQGDLGVPATGVIDAATMRALRDALTESDEEPELPDTLPPTPETSIPTGTTTTTTATPTTTQPTPTTVPPSAGNLLDVLAEAGQFNEFLAAVEASGLTETLSGPGPFTVFAPTDEAFAAAGELPTDAEALAQVILYHVVEGELSGFEVQAADSLPTLQGSELTVEVDQGIVTLAGTATMTVANVDAANGVVHTINAVLIPGG